MSTLTKDTRIIIGQGSCGVAAGAARVSDLLKTSIADDKLDIPVEVTGCIGMCYLEPIVEVFQNGEHKRYVNIDDNKAMEIYKSIKGEENTAEEYLIPTVDTDNLNSQVRIVLERCGVINPDTIDDYLETDGYKAIEKCIKEMTPQQVIDEVKVSRIGGRGGAGFPTWFKWQAARDNQGDQKYVICNGDEGDPGAFMDRSILEGDPHALIEGMLIAAYSIGASEGYVYVRAEYPVAIRRLKHAIQEAEENGYLGENILGSDFSFALKIKAGAGAFVCGEETALIASLEGERGMPRLKPPFPAERGFWQKPSNINNVETYANIPWILRHGGQAFAEYGTENSTGTKAFALTGKIAKGGLVEIPMGRSIREVIYGVGGGIKDDREFKAVQMGGPSGGCIPAELIDTEIDYQSLAKTGAIMGSGGMVVMDETTCMVEMARFFLDFTYKESCGKCTHCRIGTKRMLEILDRMVDGTSKEGDIELLYDLAIQVSEGSLCGLGQTAPNPVLTTMKYFMNEYEDHVIHKKCTAKQCKALLTYTITDNCTGCTLCARKCPTGAITGEVRKLHVIDQEKCIQCGDCFKVCRFDAVNVE